MPGATLEIHQINVSQGDATLIIVRDLALLAAKVTNATAQADPMAHLPWCVKSSVDISSTVVSAVLIDGGNNRFGDKVWAYMKQVGAIDPSPAVVFQPKLHVMVNHAHGDHLDGLESLFRYVDPRLTINRQMFDFLEARYQPPSPEELLALNGFRVEASRRP